MNFTVDPQSPEILLFEIPYFLAMGAMFFAAYRSKNGWIRATWGAFAVSLLAWHTLAILPSWWLYYAEGTLGWGGQGCVAIDASCIKQTLKDTVVVVQNAAVLGAFVVGFIIYQRKFPKQLAPDEPKLEATGGYK